MALVDNAWYVNYGDGSTTGYYAVAAWTALTSYDCGALVRQLTAPAVGSERCFISVVGHVASGASEPTWVITRGGKTTDATITWQECTGIAGINGDKTNTPIWTTVKNTAVTLGQVITDVAGTIYLICTTAGTAGNGAEPSWAAYTTAGATTADNTVTWTNVGVVGNFTGWQAPHARLANAFTATWGQAGNSFFVGSSHAETQTTAMTLTSPGTSAAPCFVYSSSTAAAPPTGVTAGATITENGSNISYAGHVAYYGFTLFMSTAGGGNHLVNTNAAMVFDTCNLKLGASGLSQFMLGNAGGSGNASNKTVLTNCTLTFGSTAQSVGLQQGNTILRGCTLATNAPTTFITQGANPNLGGRLSISGSDLSLLAGSSTIMGAIASAVAVTIIDCKLGASVTGAAAITSRGGATLDLIRCDSGATNYRTERYWYEGTQTVETTIVRTGGATNGTTISSWKIATTANSKWAFPFESLPITIWNDSTSAITTLTFYGTTTGGGLPNNDDIWVEAEYLGSGSTPLGSYIVSTKASNLAASSTTNNSSDGSTWGGGGAGNGFKIIVPSFTPGMKGPINITIKVAKASTTYYIDPMPSISGVTVSKSAILAPGVFTNERSSGGGGFIIGGQ